MYILPNTKVNPAQQAIGGALLIAALAGKAKKAKEKGNLRKKQEAYLSQGQGIPEAARYLEPSEGIKLAADIQTKKEIADKEYGLKEKFYKEVEQPGRMSEIQAQGEQARLTSGQQQEFTAGENLKNRAFELRQNIRKLGQERKLLQDKYGMDLELTKLQGQNQLNAIGASAAKELQLFNQKQQQQADDNNKWAEELENNAAGLGLDQVQARALANTVRSAGTNSDRALGYALNFLEKSSSKTVLNKIGESLNSIDSISPSSSQMDEESDSSPLY